MLRQLTNDQLHSLHDRLLQVMAAVNNLNQRDRGRPTDVKLTFLEKYHPSEAKLAMMLLEGDFKGFYAELCESVAPAQYHVYDPGSLSQFMTDASRFEYDSRN